MWQATLQAVWLIRAAGADKQNASTSWTIAGAGKQTTISLENTMTTSPCSANAPGLPDRRRLLATLAGASALGLPALPIPAVARGPIEALFAEHCRLEAQLDIAATVSMNAEEDYAEPPRPIWHPITSAGGYEMVPTSKGRGFVYVDVAAENVAYLRELAADPRDTDANGFACHDSERAKQTLAEIDAWQAEVRRRKDAAGLTEAEGAEAQASSAAGACRAAIFAAEPTTIRELAFQAALLDDDWRQLEAERVLERLVEMAGVTPYRLI